MKTMTIRYDNFGNSPTICPHLIVKNFGPDRRFSVPKEDDVYYKLGEKCTNYSYKDSIFKY